MATSRKTKERPRRQSVVARGGDEREKGMEVRRRSLFVGMEEGNPRLTHHEKTLKTFFALLFQKGKHEQP